jgi:hypothetical protein
MKLIEAAKRALEALEYAHATCKYENERQSKSIADLREAIAEAEKTEPVARVVHRIIEAGHDTHQATSFAIKLLHVNPLEWPVFLYASPPPAQPISREQVREIYMRHGFVIKEGHDDLKEYVYSAADELVKAAISAQRKPLTEKEVDECWAGLMPGGYGKSIYDIARAIEAKHGIGDKNEPR